MKNLGKKIVVVGVSASGKTTFSERLSAKINLPFISMDSIMWKPGWDYIGDNETAKELRKISSAEKWIIEGYITTRARTFLFKKADTIIYLDYPGHLSVMRYIKRWWKHRKNPRPELPGSPEKFNLKTFWLILTKGESITLNKLLTEVADQSKIVTLHSPQKSAEFLNNL